jgi:hypothetical protein
MATPGFLVGWSDVQVAFGPPNLRLMSEDRADVNCVFKLEGVLCRLSVRTELQYYNNIFHFMDTVVLCSR